MVGNVAVSERCLLVTKSMEVYNLTLYIRDVVEYGYVAGRVMAAIVISHLLVLVALVGFSYGAPSTLQPPFSAIFAFGDSTMDTGNNNFIASLLQSNHKPYGMNFPGSTPTGRFSDGKLIPDFLASFLGLKGTLPPFLDPHLSLADMLNGVCFASAGAGYDEITNQELGIIPMTKQIELMRRYIGMLNESVGSAETQRIIKNAIFLVGAGSNDFTLTYYDLGVRKLQFPEISEYQDFILTQMQSFVKELYNLGARKMAILGLPPLGCLPFQKTFRLQGPNCVDYQNLDFVAYNQKFVAALGSLQQSLHGVAIAYADFYDPIMDMVNNPQNYGLTDTEYGCCGTGKVEVAYLCSVASPTCRDPSRYLFFDSIHPSQTAYYITTQFIVKQLLSHKAS